MTRSGSTAAGRAASTSRRASSRNCGAPAAVPRPRASAPGPRARRSPRATSACTSWPSAASPSATAARARSRRGCRARSGRWPHRESSSRAPKHIASDVEGAPARRPRGRLRSSTRSAVPLKVRIDQVRVIASVSERNTARGALSATSASCLPPGRWQRVQQRKGPRAHAAEITVDASAEPLSAERLSRQPRAPARRRPPPRGLGLRPRGRRLSASRRAPRYARRGARFARGRAPSRRARSAIRIRMFSTNAPMSGV